METKRHLNGFLGPGVIPVLISLSFLFSQGNALDLRQAAARHNLQQTQKSRDCWLLLLLLLQHIHNIMTAIAIAIAVVFVAAGPAAENTNYPQWDKR